MLGREAGKHSVTAAGAVPSQLPAWPGLPGKLLTFPPGGGSRDVGEWKMVPPKAERTVLLGVALEMEVPLSCGEKQSTRQTGRKPGLHCARETTVGSPGCTEPSASRAPQRKRQGRTQGERSCPGPTPLPRHPDAAAAPEPSPRLCGASPSPGTALAQRQRSAPGGVPAKHPGSSTPPLPRKLYLPYFARCVGAKHPPLDGCPGSASVHHLCLNLAAFLQVLQERSALTNPSGGAGQRWLRGARSLPG